MKRKRFSNLFFLFFLFVMLPFVTAEAPIWIYKLKETKISSVDHFQTAPDQTRTSSHPLFRCELVDGRASFVDTNIDTPKPSGYSVLAAALVPGSKPLFDPFALNIRWSLPPKIIPEEEFEIVVTGGGKREKAGWFKNSNRINVNFESGPDLINVNPRLPMTALYADTNLFVVPTYRVPNPSPYGADYRDDDYVGVPIPIKRYIYKFPPIIGPSPNKRSLRIFFSGATRLTPSGIDGKCDSTITYEYQPELDCREGFVLDAGQCVQQTCSEKQEQISIRTALAVNVPQNQPSRQPNYIDLAAVFPQSSPSGVTGAQSVSSPHRSQQHICTKEWQPTETSCSTVYCTKGQMDFSETDVDCGGDCPKRCILGQGCIGDSDCLSKGCDPETKRCKRVCHKPNWGGYLLVDNKCPAGYVCQTNDDCQSNRCSVGLGVCLARQECADQNDLEFSDQEAQCGGPCAQMHFCTQGPYIRRPCRKDTDCKLPDQSFLDLILGNQPSYLGLCSDYRCVDDKRCNLNRDCASHHCKDGKCIHKTCTDTIQNGRETDVDCGGDCDTKCATHKFCLENTDCQSNSCDHDTKRCSASETSPTGEVVLRPRNKVTGKAAGNGATGKIVIPPGLVTICVGQQRIETKDPSEYFLGEIKIPKRGIFEIFEELIAYMNNEYVNKIDVPFESTNAYFLKISGGVTYTRPDGTAIADAYKYKITNTGKEHNSPLTFYDEPLQKSFPQKTKVMSPDNVNYHYSINLPQLTGKYPLLFKVKGSTDEIAPGLPDSGMFTITLYSRCNSGWKYESNYQGKGPRCIQIN